MTIHSSDVEAQTRSAQLSLSQMQAREVSPGILPWAEC